MKLEALETPEPRQGEVLIKVSACGVCHTELDEIEGRTPPRSLPITPGHQVTGQVVALGPGCEPSMLGRTVGVAWIFAACGDCEYCMAGKENLCGDFVATGRDRDGGYAQYMTARADFAIPLPEQLDCISAAPLLCAGAVGYRALEMASVPEGGKLGLTGFGASGHLVLQMAQALSPAMQIAVYARNEKEQQFALGLGADWAGDTAATAPFSLDAIIDTTPAWLPVLAALKQLKPGGKLIINAIRKEEHDKPVLQDLDYPGHLWMEKSVQSVANVSRKNVRDCLELAARANIRPSVTRHKLADANAALQMIQQGGSTGAHVLYLNQD